MMIHINSVYEHINNHSLIRIIYIDHNIGALFYMKMEVKTAVPQLFKLDDFELMKEYKITNDPYAVYIDEEEITEKDRVKRDAEWSVVSTLWLNHQFELMFKESRNKLIVAHANKNNMTSSKLRRKLIRFLQRGMKKNSLLADYYKSGGKGKSKAASTIKRGRPRETPLLSDENTGINVDERVANLIKGTIKKYYNNRKKAPLRHAYDMLLVEHFSDTYYEDGEMKVKLWSKDKRPTYRQFEYWFHKEKNEKDTFISRNSEKEYQLTLRELLSDSNSETYGPGFRYQIDATIGDIYLLSSLNREHIIGRPVVYSVMDVYSRLVVGTYVGLEGPSWIGAMLALDNVLEDKVEFCKRFGVKISSDEWPNSLLPEIIIADRGEFEGYNVENLINNLNITIENTPPYRGDLKGIVERRFRTINGKIKYMLPGAVMKQYRQRGDKDYRLDATYTLEEFTAFILESTIDHNNSVIEKYLGNKEMTSDEVAPIPVEIWNWGIKNKRCVFVSHDREVVRMNLLPKGKALLTRRGIRFQNAYYSSHRAFREQWYGSKHKRSLNIVYDPYNMDSLFVMTNNGLGTEFEQCHLTDASKAKFSGLSYEQMRFNNYLDTEITKEAKDRSIENRLNRKLNIDSITSDSRKQKSASSVSDRKRVKSIKEHRRNEKESNQGNRVFENSSESRENFPSESSVETKLKSKITLLSKKRDEKRGRSS